MSGLFDVAIVGLGPVGGVLAGLLGQAGVKTVVLDRADDIFPLPRAVGFDHEIMRVFQNLGLTEAIAPHVTPYRPTDYRGAAGQVIARYASLPAPFPQGWEPSFVFTQPPVEQALRALLRNLPAVEVRLSTEFVDLAEAGDHVVLSVRGPDGAPGEIRARYVVGCDGGTSPVRKRLGIRFESLDFDEPWLVVDVRVNADKLDRLPDNIVQYCDPARPTTYVVGPGNHRRWEFMLLPGEAGEEMNRTETLWRLLAPWLTPEDATLWRAAPYVFHALVAEEWRRGRVFLAGDAAHMTPPFMAQGMCQGIRDAANLAWRLELVLAGRADDALLDAYQTERRPHVRATTETAKALGRIICERDPELARARDARMLAEVGDPPAVRHRQNLIPGLAAGSLCAEQGAPAGTRFPQPWVAAGEGWARLDDVAGAGFRLVVTAGTELPADLPPALARLGGAILELREAGSPAPVRAGTRAIVERDGVLAAWMQAQGVCAVLVRPDHYVFAVARGPEEIARMAGDLHARLPGPGDGGA